MYLAVMGINPLPVIDRVLPKIFLDEILRGL
jgi:hypothetical protein